MKKEKPLPKPPNTPFGRKKPFEHEDAQGGLIADRMAAAMAEGKLDEFLKKEMPDNEYARNLAGMMMGMTGMMPDAAAPAIPSSSEKAEQPGPLASTIPDQETTSEAVPEDVKKAIQGGDVQELVGLLRREHRKRMPGADQTAAQEPTEPPSQPAAPTAIDKDLIDALIQIARDNNVSLDWMILRAIKVYVQDYQKTGRL